MFTENACWCGRKGCREECEQEGEFTASAAAVGSTSISAVPSRLHGNSAAPCTELGQAGMTRSRLSSEECSRTSGGSSGEKISSQVLHTALGTKDSDEGVVLVHL